MKPFEGTLLSAGVLGHLVYLDVYFHCCWKYTRRNTNCYKANTSSRATAISVLQSLDCSLLLCSCRSVDMNSRITILYHERGTA